MTYEPINGTTVIGLGHKARQGKDTLANRLIDRLGSKAYRVGFADALYAVCRVEHGMTVKDPKLLQYVGTEVYREKDPETWVKALYYAAIDRAPRVLIIPDVRFPNEARFVKQMGGVLVKVSRIQPDGSVWLDPARSHGHPSEVSLDDYEGWDYQFRIEDGNLGVHDQYADILVGDLGL